MPYQACHRLEDYISLTEKKLAAFYEKRIFNLEDIEDKGWSVLKSIKGIGPARQKVILEIIDAERYIRKPDGIFLWAGWKD